MNSGAQENAFTGKRSNMSQKRVYWLIGIALFCGIIIILGISIPIGLMQNHDQNERESRWRNEIEMADYWASLLRSTAIDSISISHQLEGFVMGSMKSTPPFNGTVDERVEGQYLERFDGMSEYMNSLWKYMSSFILAPGGVVLQSYPQDEDLRLYDLLAYNAEPADVPPMDTIESGNVAVMGPKLAGIPTLGSMWQLLVRNPIYNASRRVNASKSNFWGFSYVVVDVDAVLDDNDFDNMNQRRGLDYLVYTVGHTMDTIVPIRYSLKKKATVAELSEFIAGGTNRTVLRTRTSWYICMRSFEKEPNLRSTNIVLIVLAVVLCALIVFALCATLVFVCMRDYNGAQYAPKMAPFAMAVIGPCSGMELWDLASDRMAGVMERFAQLQQREIVRHKAYEGTQLHPYTTTVITRKVETAVNLCFSLLEELRTQPIDGPLQDLLGDDGKLLVACAVHWCVDANVRVEGATGILRYEGADVMYGGRMWIFASPNNVTISERVRDMVGGIPNATIEPLGAVFLRGVKERQNLSILLDAKNKNAHVGIRKVGNHSSALSSSLVNDDHVAIRQDPLSAASDNASSHFDLSSNGMQGSCHSETRVNFLSSDLDGESKRAGAHSEAGRGLLKRPFQVHVPKTLIELVPTDVVSNPTCGANPLMTMDSPIGVCQVELVHAFDSTSNMPREQISNRDGDRNGPRRGQKSSESSSQTGTSMSRGGSFNSSGCRRFPKGTLHTNGVDNPVDLPLPIDVTGYDGNASAIARTTSEVSLIPLNGDFVTDALLHPQIPVVTDTHLREVFEQQMLLLDLSYDSVRIILYYFYSAFKHLMKPLAAPERANIFRRLAIAFGVPQRNILEHLAVRCAMRHIQHFDDARSFFWNHEQQMRLGGKPRTTASSGDRRTSDSLTNSITTR